MTGSRTMYLLVLHFWTLYDVTDIVVADNFAYVGITRAVSSKPKSCVDVYDIRTKEHILFVNINDADQIQLYKEGGKVKLLARGKQILQYEVTFDFHETLLKLQLERSVLVAKAVTNFKLLSSNVLMVADLLDECSFFSTHNEQFVNESQLQQSKNFSSFMYDNCFVQLDERCKNAVFTTVSTPLASNTNAVTRRQWISHKPGVKLSRGCWRQTLLFDGAVFIMDMAKDNGRIYLLMLDSWTLYDVTERVIIKWKHQYVARVEAAAQDEEAIYLIVTEYKSLTEGTFRTKMVRLTVNGSSLRSLTANDMETQTEDTNDSLQLSCPVCLESYGTPKMLTNCGHSICETCEPLITEKIWPSVCENADVPQSRVGKCSSCGNRIPAHQFFECSECSSGLRLSQMLLCGVCVVRNHSDHISEVTEAQFLNDQEIAAQIPTLKFVPPDMDAELLLCFKKDPQRTFSSIVIAGNFVYVASHTTFTVGQFTCGQIFPPQPRATPCIHVYDIRTKKRVASASGSTLDVHSSDKMRLFKDDEGVKLLAKGIHVQKYEVVFDVQTNSLTCRVDSSISLITDFELLSSSILRATNIRESILNLQSMTFPFFKYGNRFVYLDKFFKHAVFMSPKKEDTQLITHKPGIKLPEDCLRRTFVFGQAVFIVDMEETNGRIYLLMLDSWTLYDVTERVNIKGERNFVVSIVAASEDSEAIYLAVTESENRGGTLQTKIVKLPVNDSVLRSLTGGELETPTGSAKDSLQISCPICLAPYGTPKMLTTCGHSICNACEPLITEKRWPSKTLKCPICRKVTNIGWNEVLPTNWSLKDICEVNRPQPKKVELPQVSALICRSCNRSTPADQFFECAKCSSEQEVQMVMCSTCVVKKHSAHISEVTEVDHSTPVRNFFEFSKCSSEQEVQMVMCSTCVVKKHSAHISEVTEAEFVNSKEVAETLAQIEPPKWSSKMEEMRVDQMASQVAQKMAKRREEAKDAIEAIKKCPSLTRKGLERHVGNLKHILKDMEKCKTLLEQTSSLVKSYRGYLSEC
uniref:RING-type domain-containing protein n=1 Tax=Steinernema glaseri TaxID=37863 RepID=A0A1I7YNQ2_9BILA